MIRTRLLMIAAFLAVGITASACMGFGEDKPAAPQQQGPVLMPIIQGDHNDNSGAMVIVAFVLVGLAGLAIWMFRHAQRESDRRRDAEALTTRILDALPDDVHREISYKVGYQPGSQVYRSAIDRSPRRAIGDGR